MDTGAAPSRAVSPCNRVLVLAATACPDDREQARAFCAFLGLHGLEAWLEFVAAGEVGELQALLDDDTIRWVLVVASRVLAGMPADVPPDRRHRIVPVVLPGGCAEELRAWADPRSGRVVPVTEFSAEGAEPLLRIVLPLSGVA